MELIITFGVGLGTSLINSDARTPIIHTSNDTTTTRRISFKGPAKGTTSSNLLLIHQLPPSCKNTKIIVPSIYHPEDYLLTPHLNLVSYPVAPIAGSHKNAYSQTAVPSILLWFYKAFSVYSQWKGWKDIQNHKNMSVYAHIMIDCTQIFATRTLITRK